MCTSDTYGRLSLERQQSKTDGGEKGRRENNCVCFFCILKMWVNSSERTAMSPQSASSKGGVKRGSNRRCANVTQVCPPAMKPSRAYACTVLHGSVCAASRLAEPRLASLSMCRSIVPLRRERSKCTLSGQKSPSREVDSESQSAYHSIVLLSLTNQNFRHLHFFF